jgi:hypothetical protein
MPLHPMVLRARRLVSSIGAFVSKDVQYVVAGPIDAAVSKATQYAVTNPLDAAVSKAAQYVITNPLGAAVSKLIQYVVVEPASPPAPIPPPTPIGGGYRGQVGLNWNGMALIGDRFAGIVGRANFEEFTEYAQPMNALITSPPFNSDRLRLFIRRFELDVETGVGISQGQGSEPVWMLDWSKDGGRTFSALQIWRGMGRLGDYLTRLRWMRLGESRQWIFRLQSSDPVRRVIIGAYITLSDGQR